MRRSSRSGMSLDASRKAASTLVEISVPFVSAGFFDSPSQYSPIIFCRSRVTFLCDSASTPRVCPSRQKPDPAARRSINSSHKDKKFAFGIGAPRCVIAGECLVLNENKQCSILNEICRDGCWFYSGVRASLAKACAEDCFVHRDTPTIPTMTSSSAVPCGTYAARPLYPALKTLGYCRVSLRNNGRSIDPTKQSWHCQSLGATPHRSRRSNGRTGEHFQSAFSLSVSRCIA